MKNYESMTDEMLALQYVGGDNRAFDELLTRNQKKLYDYILFVVRDPELANDVFQETFVKVITRLQEGKYTDCGKFSFWLYRITHNVIMDTFREQKSMHIKEAHNVDTLVLPIEEAKKLGAMMLFSEKYGDKVRVVDMGVSKEFCAGTHVDNTSEIEEFAIASIESIGSGTFRCTAFTSTNAMELLKASQNNVIETLNASIAKAKELVKSAKEEGIELEYNYVERQIDVFGYRYVLALRKELAKAQEAYKELEKSYNQKKSQNALKSLDQFDSLIKNNKLAAKVEATDTNLIKDMATALRNNKNLDVVLLASVDGAKVTFVCAAQGNYDACQIVREATKITGGGGGGKKDISQAGGKDSSKVDEALAHVMETLA